MKIILEGNPRFFAQPLNSWKDRRLAKKLLAKGKPKLAFPKVNGVREFQEVFKRIRTSPGKGL